MLLSAEHLSINFGSRQLLDDVNFYLNEGDKVGVIGINGTGKSTFLKVLSGVTEPDGGTISRNPNVQVSFLSQNPVMQDDATVLEQVFLHFPAEFRALNEYEAKTMLNRLGLPDFEQKVGTLSGGQRKRVALAAALIHPADVLVLPMTEDLAPAISLSTKLRSAGVRTQLYTEQKKFKAKMNYADKLGVPYVVFLGDDEIAAGLVACKDMTSGDQTKLSFEDTLSRITQGLSQRNQGKVILEK